MKTILLVGVLAAWFLVGGCAKTQSGNLVGSWKAEDLSGVILLVLRGDGSCAMAHQTRGKTTEFFLNYKIEGQSLTLVEPDGEAVIGMQILARNEEEINVRLGGEGPIVTLKRINKDAGQPWPGEAVARSPAGRAQKKEAMVDQAIMNNVRQLAAASDQYFLENGRSTVLRETLVGPTCYVKALQTVSNETYPTAYTQGVTITVRGIAGLRTITYAP